MAEADIKPDLPPAREVTFPSEKAVRRAAGAFNLGVTALNLALGAPPQWALLNAGLGIILNFDLVLPPGLEIDLTGKHLSLPPVLSSFDIKTRRELLTPERIELGREVVEDICRRTAGYGIKPFRFSPLHLRVIRQGGQKTAATTDLLTGRITLEVEDIRSDGDFVKVLAHEYYHTVEKRRWAKRKTRRRYGLDFGEGRNINWFGEGVVEKSARISAENLGCFDYFEVYEDRVNIIDMMCSFMAAEILAERLYVSHGEISTEYSLKMDAVRAEVFSLFEGAIYGRGNLKPLFTLIQRHYSKVGGIKKLFQLITEARRLEKEENKEGCAKILTQLKNFARGIKPREDENSLSSRLS